MSRAPGIASRLLAVAAATLVVLGVGAAAAASVRTQAAWADEVDTAAVVTAGEWSTPMSNTCTAWDQYGNAVTCSVRTVSFTTWQESPTRRARDYRVEFSAPNAQKIVFSVDLTSATTTRTIESPAWSWSNAGIGSAGQFTPVSGWTCDSLPVVTGQASDWLTSVYLPIYENRTMRSVMCP